MDLYHFYIFKKIASILNWNPLYAYLLIEFYLNKTEFI